MYQLTTNWSFVFVAYPILGLMILFSIKKLYINKQKKVEEIFNPKETSLLREIAALMVLFTHLLLNVIKEIQNINQVKFVRMIE